MYVFSRYVFVYFVIGSIIYVRYSGEYTDNFSPIQKIAIFWTAPPPQVISAHLAIASR